MKEILYNNKEQNIICEIKGFFSRDIIDRINNGKKFDRFSKIYSFTNEKISNYYNHFNIELKKVLTVASS